MNYVKKVLGIVILSIIIQATIVIAQTYATEYTTEQKAMREVMDAYYNKGTKAQYCNFRLSRIYSPEEATSQHFYYSVCTSFTSNVYQQAFGIKTINANTGQLLVYAKKYYNPNKIKTNDIIEYWYAPKDENGNRIYKDYKGNIIDMDLSTEEGRKSYVTKMLKDYKLQVGDVLVYHGDSTSGHAMLVYDIIYNKNGEPVDAIIRDSSSHFDTTTTKITKGLSYDSIMNQSNNVEEGTYHERYLVNAYPLATGKTRNPVIMGLKNVGYFAIIRPLLRDENGNNTGKYYKLNPREDVSYPYGDRELSDYQITNSTLSRLNYSKIDIEKIVDVFNNSFVSLEDTLEYTINVKNNSSEKYNSFKIVENIPEYVEIIDAGNGIVNNNTITWNIDSLNKNASIEKKYKVKVKNNVANIGKEIVSTGTVAGIPSSTVKNTIAKNFTSEENIVIKNNIKALLNDKRYKGYELINKIYNDKIKIENLDITNLIKTENGTTYYPDNHNPKSSIWLNKDNIFSNQIVSNYYGALYTSSSGNVSQKKWENVLFNSRSDRAETIYSKNLRTGDVLVYKNEQVANESYQAESGTYYLVYVSKEDAIKINNHEYYGFIGLNENGELNNIYRDELEYNSRDDYSEHDLRTLLGKDYYVILRPSMVLDSTAPAISSINVTSPTAGTYKAGQEVTIVATFNENIYGTANKGAISSSNAPTLKIKFGNSTERTATYNTASGATITYKYTIASGDNGKLAITAFTGTVYDVAGNSTTCTSVAIGGNSITADTTEIEKIFTSEIYEIEQNTIKNIQPNTNLEEVVKNITSNQDYIIKEGETIVTGTDRIKTGQVLTVGDKSYTLIVTGDTNGDGQANIQDILDINKHRLNKVKLTGAYLKAGDINKDDKADIKDILLINKYRLRKINEL